MAKEGKLEHNSVHSCRPSKIRFSEREERSDRISELPDSLLLYILSYLFIDDAISTSLLSRRWNNLWKWIDSLDFPFQCGKSKRNSIKFFEKALSLYEGLKIKKFCARFRYNPNYISHVDSWVHFAIARNVEKLVLDFFCVEAGVQPYVLPVSIYKCGSLRELEVNLCSFRPPPSLCLRSLKKLVINNTIFFDETLRNIISGCPILEELILVNCNQSCDFDVVILNPNVKRLKIVEFPDEDDESTEVKICAPYLLHLELYSGDPRSYIIQDASSISSACFDIRMIDTCLSFNPYNQKNYYQIIENIIKGLPEVKTLKLSSWCIQAMQTDEGMHSCLPTPLKQLKHLKLDVQLTRDELPGIGCLLMSSPELEILTVQLCRQAHMERDITEITENVNASLSNWEEGSLWDGHQAPLYNLKHNLQKIVVENFRGDDIEIMFLAFLLRYSPTLKNVVILIRPKSFIGSGEAYVEYCGKTGSFSEKYVENIRKLVSSLRSSCTEILFTGSQAAGFISL